MNEPWSITFEHKSIKKYKVGCILLRTATIGDLYDILYKSATPYNSKENFSIHGIEYAGVIASPASSEYRIADIWPETANLDYFTLYPTYQSLFNITVYGFGHGAAMSLYHLPFTATINDLYDAVIEEWGRHIEDIRSNYMFEEVVEDPSTKRNFCDKLTGYKAYPSNGKESLIVMFPISLNSGCKSLILNIIKIKSKSNAN